MIRDPGNARRKLPRYWTTCLGNFSHLILAVRILNLSKLKETQSSWEKRGRWEENRNTRKSLGKSPVVTLVTSIPEKEVMKLINQQRGKKLLSTLPWSGGGRVRS